MWASWQDGKRVHCKYLPLSHTKALENFSKALYGTTGGTYSARIFRPVMLERIMSADKYPCIFPRQIENIVYLATSYLVNS